MSGGHSAANPVTTAGVPMRRARNLSFVTSTILRRGWDTMRTVGSTVTTTLRQTSRTRITVTALAAVTLAVIVILVPLPTAVRLRDWAESAGPWFPLVFLGAHVVVTVFPFPEPPSPWPRVCCSDRHWVSPWP